MGPSWRAHLDVALQVWRLPEAPAGPRRMALGILRTRSSVFREDNEQRAAAGSCRSCGGPRVGPLLTQSSDDLVAVVADGTAGRLPPVEYERGQTVRPRQHSGRRSQDDREDSSDDLRSRCAVGWTRQPVD